jgi:hypothetical protein
MKGGDEIKWEDIKFFNDIESLEYIIKDRLIQIQRDEKNKIDFLDLIGEYENCVDRSLSYGKELLNLQYDLKLVVQRTCGHLDALIEEFSERPPQKESIYLED